MQLIENTYFALVVAAMQEQGFKLFSQVTISNQDTHYHVPVGTARVTSLFFHLPSRNLIVRLAYNENDYWDGQLHGYWSIRIDAEFASDQSLWDLSYPPEAESDVEQKIISCTGFYHGWSSTTDLQCTWNLDQKNTRTPALAVDTLVGDLKEALDKILPHLRSAPFAKLQVTSWGPTYQFRDC